MEGLGGAEGGEGAVVSAVQAEGGGGDSGWPYSCGIISPSPLLVQELQSSEGAPLSS